MQGIDSCIIDTEKSPDLQLGSWGPGEPVWVPVWAWKHKVMSQLRDRESRSFLDLEELAEATPVGEGDLLYSVCCFKCSCHLETPSQTHPESCVTSCLGPHGPGRLTCQVHHPLVFSPSFGKVGFTPPLLIVFSWCAFTLRSMFVSITSVSSAFKIFFSSL